MIIKKLVLHNFRVFRGHHEIELTPQKRGNEIIDRPIVLFGGLNGAGKTSILSAIRLGRVRISTLRNENETFSQLNSITYIGVFLRLVTYSHLP